MNALKLKSLMAVGLSLWLGALACAIGCAQPMLAGPASHPQASSCKTGARSEAADDASCCQHGKGSSEKERPATRDASCCASEATLNQKQNASDLFKSQSSAITFTLVEFYSSVKLSASDGGRPSKVCHAGREILRQVHVLRI